MPESAKPTSVLEINQLLFQASSESDPYSLAEVSGPTQAGGGVQGLSPLTYLSTLLLSLAPGIFQGLAVREMILTFPGLLHIFCLRSGYFLLETQNPEFDPYFYVLNCLLFMKI